MIYPLYQNGSCVTLKKKIIGDCISFYVVKEELKITFTL